LGQGRGNFKVEKNLMFVFEYNIFCFASKLHLNSHNDVILLERYFNGLTRFGLVYFPKMDSLIGIQYNMV